MYPVHLDQVHTYRSLSVSPEGLQGTGTCFNDFGSCVFLPPTVLKSVKGETDHEKGRVIF